MGVYFYSVEPIGPFPGNGSMSGPVYINEANVITGMLETDGKFHCVKIENGVLTDLSPNDSYAKGAGSNDANPHQVAGRRDNQKATVWTGTNAVDISSAVGASSSSEAKDINNNGIVTGIVDGHGFTLNLNSNQLVKPLIPSADWSYPEAINNNGYVVGRGFLNFDDFWSSAFLYRPNQGTVSLWKPGFFGDFANDINDDGVVVGKAKLVNDFYYPFRYDGSIEQLGGGEKGSAEGINNKGDIVGEIYSGNQQYASLYINGQDPWINLNSRIEPGSGWTLNVAQKINNNGLIVGWGVFQNVQQTFLLRPLDQIPPWGMDFDFDLELAIKFIMFGGGGLGIFVPGGGRFHPKGPPVDPSGPFYKLHPSQRDVLVGLAVHILAGNISDARARSIAQKGGVDAIRIAVNHLDQHAKKDKG